MRTKLALILVTSVATTLFWFLAIVGVAWLAPGGSGGTSFVADACRRGWVAMMRAWNDEPRPVTFIVAELDTNAVGTNVSDVVLLRRELPPSGEFWIGIKKD